MDRSLIQTKDIDLEKSVGLVTSSIGINEKVLWLLKLIR
jgi:hypothetical protein